MAMTFGIHIGHLGGPLPEMRRLWRFADERGFDWFSIADHFQESPPQGGDLDCFESTSMMTAAAIETRRVRIGSLVYSVSYRHPAVLASTLTSIDHLSGGRLEVGIGAGWHEAEYRAFGIPFPRIGVREDQLEEFVQVLRLLFDPAIERADFSGKHFQLVNAPNNPKPLQPRVRIWIGGVGEKRTLQSVARYADGWNAPYLDPGKWKAKSRVLDEWCEKIGRDPRTIIRTVNVGFYIGADAEGARRGEALWQRHWGGDPQGRQGFFRGTPKEAIELAAAYRDAGAARVNIALRQGPYDWDALEAFAAEVVPALGGR